MVDILGIYRSLMKMAGVEALWVMWSKTGKCPLSNSKAACIVMLCLPRSCMFILPNCTSKITLSLSFVVGTISYGKCNLRPLHLREEALIQYET